MGITKTQLVKYILKGDKGPSLRGPQAWSDCTDGYNFQAGGPGDKWQDVVLYNGNYYECEISHAKTSTNYPGSSIDINNNLWQLGDSVNLVATKIFLTTYALVKNLGVETIDMKDSSGNILFQAKDGNVLCRTGTFNDVDITGDLKVAHLRYKANQVLNGKLNCSFIYGGGSYSLPEVMPGEYIRLTVFNPQLTRTYDPTILSGNNTYFLSQTAKYDETEMSLSLVGWWELIGVANGTTNLWLYQEIKNF